MKKLCDIVIFFAGTDNTGMVFHNVDRDDLEYAIRTYYSENFYTLKDEDDEDVIVNLSRVEFIRVRDRE